MTWTVTWLTCNLRRRGVKARAGLVEGLPAMRVLAKVRQQLKAQQHVLVAVRPHVDLAVVGMVMVPPARGLVRECERTDERGRASVGGVRARKDKVWPAVVRVVVRATPVGDTVADKCDRTDFLWDPCVERADEEPRGHQL